MIYNNIIKIKHLTAIVVLASLCLAAGGCSMRDSGLYRVNAAESSAEYETSEQEQNGEGTVNDTTITDTDGSSDRITSPGQIDPNQDKPLNLRSGQESSTPDGNTTPTSEPATVYVHVCGAVNTPGVYELDPGTRIFGAIEAAGGFTEDAATDYVNLAELVSDGMKITIPTMEEAERSEAGNEPGFTAVEYPSETGTASGAGTSGSGTSGTSQIPGGLININTATEDELMTLTGIGEGKARAIITYREEHGAFSQIEDIKNVSGIGDATFNKFKDSIIVGTK